jgi:hypothetical protein
MNESLSGQNTITPTFNLLSWLGGAFGFGFMLFPVVLLSFMVPFIGPQLALSCCISPIAFLVIFVIKASRVPKGPTRPPVPLIIALIPLLIILQILGYVAFSGVMDLTGHSEWLDIGAHIA